MVYQSPHQGLKRLSFLEKMENKDVLYIKKTITETVKSFDENLNKDLLCKIKTQKKANAEAEQYMLNVLT